MLTYIFALSLFQAALPVVDITNARPNDISVPFQANDCNIGGLRMGADYSLTWEGDGKTLEIPVQVSPQRGGSLFGILPAEAVSSEGDIEATIHESQGKNTQPLFQFVERDDKQLYIYEGSQPVLAYNFGVMSCIGAPLNRARSCYISPLYDLDGVPVSEDFPKDHYHHRGLFWTWPQVMVGDKKADLWMANIGGQQFGNWLYKEKGQVCALFGVRNYWHVGGEKVVEEIAEFTIYRAGEAGRAIDVRLRWKSLGEPVAIQGQDTGGYGGFNLRPAPRSPQLPVITTSGGVQEKDSNLVPFPWGDYSADFYGRGIVSGVAIFVDKGHSGYPPGWTLRHYGFLGVAWPGNVPLQIPTDHYLEAKYRVWIHKGDCQVGRVEEAFGFFDNPPLIRMMSDE